MLCQTAEFQTLTGSLMKIFNSSNLSTNKSTHWSKPKKRNNQSHPPPAVAPMEKETRPIQLAKEVTTEAIIVEAAQTPKIEECQTTPQTPIVSRFLSVLKPVAATVMQQITSKTHF